MVSMIKARFFSLSLYSSGICDVLHTGANSVRHRQLGAGTHSKIGIIVRKNFHSAISAINLSEAGEPRQ